VNKFFIPLIVTVVGGVIAAALVAQLHIGNSPPGGTGPSNSCVLLWPSELGCTSSDPRVTLDDQFLHDCTAGSTINYQISWGDGSPIQSLNHTVGAAGPFFVADHTYGQKGTYSIQLNDTATSGSCQTIPVDYSFTFG
jgi:hypothetical protein